MESSVAQCDKDKGAPSGPEEGENTSDSCLHPGGPCGQFNNKLDWTRNTKAVYKKGQSQLFFLTFAGSEDVLWVCYGQCWV